MKVSLWVSPVVSVVVLFGSVGVATITGDWVTGGRQQVVQGAPLSVDGIKGWMTLQQAADGLGIPVARVIELIDAPGSVGLAPTTAFKDVEALVPGFELTSFRDLLRGALAASPAASGPSPSRR
ncbi:MAG: hypothetical protein ACOH1Y_08610 [Propionicimonas sp.]